MILGKINQQVSAKSLVQEDARASAFRFRSITLQPLEIF